MYEQKAQVNVLYLIKHTNCEYIRYFQIRSILCPFVCEIIFSIDVVKAEKIEAKIL